MAVPSFSPCPLLGSAYPPPTSLSSAPVIQAALSNITNAFNSFVETGISPNGAYPANSTAFSVGVFSTNDNSSDPFWQYHYTSPQVVNSTEGVTKVDENSIYRIGSITKLFSTYAFLVEAGDGYWEQPITKYIPEIAAASKGDPKEGDRDVERFRWQDITMAQLAGQTSGLGRDYIADYASALQGEAATSVGLPPLNLSEIPACTLTNICNREEFFKWFLQTKIPTLIPGKTPAYSNQAWQFFGYAVQGITNKTLDQIISERIYKPLNMSQSSFSQPPNPKLGVLAQSVNASGWTLEAGDETPGGYMYSSLRDMTTAGRSMLASTLLTPAETRRWLKPRSHTSTLTESVGLPWEIERGPVSPNNSRIVDAYTKGGNLGDWGTLLVLFPEYNAGFNFLGARIGGVDPSIFADIVASYLLPALEQTAKDQTNAKYGGSYKAQGLNSSMELTTAEIAPGLNVGLNVVEVISNGTDLIASVAGSSGIPGSLIATQLYPSGLRSTSNGTVQTAFNLISTTATSATSPSRGFFTQDCESWFTVNNIDYGDLPLDEFIFYEDEKTGKVTAVEVPALRVVMEKVA